MFGLRFNHYKSNIKLYGEGRRGFKQEKLIEHLLFCSHNGKHEDIKIRMIQTIKKPDRTFGFSIWTLHIQKV